MNNLKYSIILSSLLLSGCSSYYASFGVGQMQARNWLCSNAVLGVSRIGGVYELNKNHQLDAQLEHESMVDCGSPSNNREESDKDTISIHYKYIFGE